MPRKKNRHTVHCRIFKKNKFLKPNCKTFVFAISILWKTQKLCNKTYLLLEKEKEKSNKNLRKNFYTDTSNELTVGFNCKGWNIVVDVRHRVRIKYIRNLLITIFLFYSSSKSCISCTFCISLVSKLSRISWNLCFSLTFSILTISISCCCLLCRSSANSA